MSRPRRYAVVVAMLTATAPLGGCFERAADKQLDSSERQLQCSDQATAVTGAYPDQVPAKLPLPGGTTVYRIEDRGKDGVVLSAVSKTPFKDVLAFMTSDFVAAGFAITHGETEKHDAEANWVSTGYRGRWAIREITAQCPGDTLISVLTTKRS